VKILSIQINGKTYMTGKITAFLSKEALKIQRDSLELGKIGKEVQQDGSNLDRVGEMLDMIEDLNKRKAWLICEVYQNQFTPDELEKELSSEEITLEVNRIIFGVTGIISKN
jgi:hypothetical protein